MGQELTKNELMAEEALDIFDKISREVMTPQQIAEEKGYSLKTVYNRINQGRSIVYEEIRAVGSKYLSVVWKRYEYLWDQAKVQWDISKDPVYLKEMRSVLEAMRKMMSIDAPAKAPVNEDGKAIPNSLIMVFSDDAYKVKELEDKMSEQKTIDGDFTVTDSTDVPLTSDGNDVK